jgi:hypothetical protein
MKDPVLLHHPTRKSVGYFGAVRLRDGKFCFSREVGKFDAVTTWAFLRRTAASLPTVTQFIVFSNDLNNWSEEPSATTTTSPIDDLWELATVTDGSPVTARRFVREVVSP